MKITKILTTALAVTAAVALCSSAKAQVGTSLDNLALSVNLTVRTNNPVHDNGASRVYTTRVVKITNKNLLSLFETWAAADVASSNAPVGTVTSFPVGARLVFSYSESFYSKVLVVDKTGTNVLYVVPSQNSDLGHYFQLDFYDEDNGAFTEVHSDSTSTYNETDYAGGYYEIYDNSANIDLWGYGPSFDVYSFNSKSSVYQETDRFNAYESSNTLLGNEATTSGAIVASGHFKD